MADFSRTRGNELIVHPSRSGGSQTVLYLEPMNNNNGGSAEPEGSFSLQIGRVIQQRLPWIVGALILGCLLGFGFSLKQTPIYEARLSLEIQNPAEMDASLKVGDEANVSLESYLPTQIAILKSRTLHRSALARLHNQKFHSTFEPPSHLSQIRKILRLSPEPLVQTSAVTVDIQPTANTRIVTIVCESPDPQFAAAFANALVNEYIDSNLKARWDAINTARQWLAQQLDETRTKLQESEERLQSYAAASHLLFTGDKESAEQDKLKEMQTALFEAEAERIAKQSQYQIAMSTSADSVPQVLDNPELTAYSAKLADLRRQLADLSAEYTPEHPKVRHIQAQIDDLEQSFLQERTNVITRIKNEYQSAMMKERLLSGAYQEQVKIVTEKTQDANQYNIMQRDVETNRTLYDSLLQKSHEADTATALRGSNARIVDAAEPPFAPSKPNFTWNTLIGALAGLLLGMGLVVVQESLDRSYKQPGDTSTHLNVPELGVIPERNLMGTYGYKRPTALPSADVAADSTDSRVEVVTWREKSSMIAESFRGAVTSILYSLENGASTRVILVSSAIRGEGKTTIVSNLGIALAEINHRVLLIDGDLRKPRLNEVFNLPNDWGLSDLLREESSLRDCPVEALVKQTEMPELNVLTSGPGTENIPNLLYSHRMLELLQRLRSEFDVILIDTPPLLDIADARILGRLADAAILVLRAGRTSRDAAMAAKKRLTDDGIPVLGTILNAWDSKTTSRYGYSYTYAEYE
jgi:succinoglycan biosynthesis transport protein ExoP